MKREEMGFVVKRAYIYDRDQVEIIRGVCISLRVLEILGMARAFCELFKFCF